MYQLTFLYVKFWEREAVNIELENCEVLIFGIGECLP